MENALIEQIRKNFEYDYWANDQYIKALLEMSQPPEKAVKIFAHILFALDVWLARLMKEDLSQYKDPTPPYSLLESRKKLDDLHEKWKRYLAIFNAGGDDREVHRPQHPGKTFRAHGSKRSISGSSPIPTIIVANWRPSCTRRGQTPRDRLHRLCLCDR